MGAAGIREMLLAALPAAVRCRLLGLDKDDASGIQAPDNDFVRAVVHRAGGNPLYVRFLLDDLELGLSLDKGRLPQGLEGYYSDLLNRLGASDVAHTVPPVVALLACAEEPLPPKSLLALIPHAPSARVLDEALLLGGAMFRYAPTPDGQEGLTLYHTNFREYILREDSPLSETVTKARRLLWERAEAWAEEEDGGLQGHLFRKGNGYALAWGGDKGRAQVLERLADFTYLMARLARPETSDLNGLLEEYRQLRSNALASLAVWEEFFRTHIHVLRRGDLGGVADRLLFTQALNSAGAGTVQSAAEDYLAYGQVTWHYLRVSSVAPPQARPTLTFDRNSIVTGVINLSGDYLLAYYADGNVTRWNVRTGAAVWSMHVHEGPVLGVIVLDDMRCLSWAMQDRHLKIWSLEDGQPIVQSKPAHSSYLGVQGVVAIAPDRVLSWSADGILSQWSALSLERLAQIQTTLIVRSCHSLSDASVLLLCDDGVYRWDFVNGSTPNEILSCSQSAILSDGRILTANAQTLTLWNAGLTDVIAELPGKLREAKTAAAGGNGSVLLEVDSNCLCLWHPESGATATMAEHDSPIDGFELLPDGRILTWSRNQAVCVWDPSLGQVTTRVAHHDWIRGALLLDRASLLTWADDRKMCLWHLSQQQPSTEATLPARLPVKGVVELDATRLILWDDSETLRLWNAEIETCAPLDGLHEFSVNGVIANSSRHLLSWDDKTVHVRDYRTLELIAVLRNKKGRLADVMPLDGDRLLTWAEGDNVLRLWRIDTQVEIASFAAPAPVCGARRMTRERILVWLSDRTLHLISARDLSALSVLPSKGSISASFGHAKSVTLAGELDTGEVFSWSRGEEILRFWDFDNDRMLRPLCGVTSMDELPHGWFHLEFRDGHPGLWKPGRDLDVDARLIRLGRGPVRGSLMTDGADLVVGECGAWVIDGLREPKEAPSVRRELAVMQGEVMQVGVGPWRRPTQEPTASCRTADWYNPSIRRLLHAWPDGRFLVDADGPVCLHLHMGMERLPWA